MDAEQNYDFGVSTDPDVWREYERRKKLLPIEITPDDYDKAISEICLELGI